MNPDELIATFRDRKFEVDCTEMVLTQRASNEPIVFSGKGRISQGADGALEFKLYAETVNTDPTRFMMQVELGPAGKIIGEDRYFDLKATTWDSEEWSASYISLNPKWSKEFKAVVGGKLHEVVLKRATIPGRHLQRLVLFEELRFPSNIGRQLTGQPIVTSHSALGYDFEFSQADGLGAVTVSADEPLPSDLHYRVHEALKFVTATPAPIRATIFQGNSREEIRLHSPDRRALPTQAFPPLHLNSPMLPRDGLAMFSKYLEYVIKEGEGDYLHPLTYHLDNAAAVSAGSIDSWAIGLSVAAEGIAGLVEPPDLKAHRALVAELHKWTKLQLKGCQKFDVLKDRIFGLIGMLGNVRPQDRIEPLAAAGHINRAYLKTWKGLRNNQVHPRKSETETPDGPDYQAKYTALGTVTTLVYQVAFYLIGYSGLFTDYGAPAYPEVPYPLIETPMAKPAGE